MADLLQTIETLKSKAKRFEQEQANAQMLIGKLTAQKDQLSARLETEFGLTDWSKAEQLCQSLTEQLESLTEQIKEALGRAGVEL